MRFVVALALIAACETPSASSHNESIAACTPTLLTEFDMLGAELGLNGQDGTELYVLMWANISPWETVQEILRVPKNGGPSEILVSQEVDSFVVDEAALYYASATNGVLYRKDKADGSEIPLGYGVFGLRIQDSQWLYYGDPAGSCAGDGTWRIAKTGGQPTLIFPCGLALSAVDVDAYYLKLRRSYDPPLEVVLRVDKATGTQTEIGQVVDSLGWPAENGASLLYIDGFHGVNDIARIPKGPGSGVRLLPAHIDGTDADASSFYIAATTTSWLDASQILRWRNEAPQPDVVVVRGNTRLSGGLLVDDEFVYFIETDDQLRQQRILKIGKTCTDVRLDPDRLIAPRQPPIK